MGQGTQTEEAGESIDAEDEDYEEDAAIEDVVEEPVELRILKMLNLNWKNFDDRCVIFPHFYVYCHYIEEVKLHLYLTHNS